MASDQNKAKSVSSPSIGYSGGSVRARLTTLSSPFIMAEGKITIPPPIGLALLVSPCGARGRRSAGATRRNVVEPRARSASCPRRPSLLLRSWLVCVSRVLVLGDLLTHLFYLRRGAGREPGACWRDFPRPGARLVHVHKRVAAA